MGVRVIGDYKMSVMYCSTTDWAFGPVFHDDNDKDADERIQSFLRYLKGVDPRSFTERELSRHVSEWMAQEQEQWQAEELAETLKEFDD
jgi:hypothetical protein